MTNKNRIILHLFYNQEFGSMGEVRTVKKAKKIILFEVSYDNIPSTIGLIVAKFYETCAWHEIHSITNITDELYISGKLI